MNQTTVSDNNNITLVIFIYKFKQAARTLQMLSKENPYELVEELVYGALEEVGLHLVARKYLMLPHVLINYVEVEDEDRKLLILDRACNTYISTWLS